jgi:DNA-binding NtrC family response regulator
LLAEVSAGRFREDLYFRLAVVPIVLPPLRERENDVLELVEHFLAQTAVKLNRKRVEVDAAARELMCNYTWPGNVRELQNIITRACVLNQGTPIKAAELRPWLREEGLTSDERGASADGTALNFGEITLDEMERRLIVATLKRCDGHRAKAAEKLGIGLRTLSGKLRAYGYAPREKDFAGTE